MTRLLPILLTLLSLSLFGQIPAYYNDVNLTLTGQALKTELAQKITVTHTNILDYSDVWVALKLTDLDPTNSANVLLLYGYNDGDGDVITDRTRNKDLNGGNVGDWNREHTFPKSLGQPNLGTSGPGADAHHLRSTDVQRNGNRGSRKFAAGSGNGGTTGANWYPGDEWKGDVARMMMYMYLRYDNQCYPTYVGVGSTVPTDANMIDLFLQWNAEDTVSTYETNRNNILESQQGNRNPFIDNPYLATIIWDGVVAMDKWEMTLSVSENDLNNYFMVYPNPSTEVVNIKLTHQGLDSDNEQMYIYNVNGKLIREYSDEELSQQELKINDLSQGVYILKYQSDEHVVTKKIVVN